MDFVIGDIHGEISKLKDLVDNILGLDLSAKFVFIGDYVDKGENSKETLGYLHKLQRDHECVFLKGNHEFFWLSKECGGSRFNVNYDKYGFVTTLNDYGIEKTHPHEISKLWPSTLTNLKLYYETERYFVCHAGLTPSAFDLAPAELKEEDLLFNRYDFLKTKRLYRNKKIIFGHTGFYDVFYDGFKIGVDTAACYVKSQPLTSFCLDQDFFIDSSGLKRNLSEIPLNRSPNIARVIPYRREALNEK